MHLDRILRFPVKSLSAEDLHTTVLTPGEGLPFDRQWALARPDSEAAVDHSWHAKSSYMVLVKERRLATLKSRFDEHTSRLWLDAPDGLHAEGLLTTEDGRNAIASAVGKHLELEPAGWPVLVEADDIAYFDTTKGPISLLNMASLRELEKILSHKLDPVRFRMNLFLEGGEAWAEQNWPGKHIAVGETLLAVTENTGRCAATHINPETGEKDTKVLHALKDAYGHTQMGVYATVIEGGAIRKGDQVQVLE